MTQQTSFDLDHAKALQAQLNRFSGTFQGEWRQVLNHWGNLKSCWHDKQFDQFELFFEKLASTYETTIEECNEYEYFLAKQIQIAEEQKSKLGNLVSDVFKKTVATAQIGSAVVGMVTSPKAQVDIERQATQLYSYQQKAQAESREKEIDTSAIAKNVPATSGSSGSPTRSDQLIENIESQLEDLGTLDSNLENLVIDFISLMQSITPKLFQGSRNSISVLMLFTSLYAGIIASFYEKVLGAVDVHNRVVAPLTGTDSPSWQIKSQFDEAFSNAGITSELQDLIAVQDSEKKKRKEQYKNLSDQLDSSSPNSVDI